MTLGPDGKLYFNNGAPNNILIPSYLQASILRLDPKTDVLESYAQGVRNSVGMAFHPVTHQLWFTDNGRDWLSEDLPEDKLSVATKKGENFGYPFCHEGDFLDPEFGQHRSCAEFTPPVAKLGAHTAPLGVRFYTGKMFPAEYRNNLFIARHGSWNRSKKQGYDVVRAVIGAGGKVKIEPFLTGFLQDPSKDPPMWGAGRWTFWSCPTARCWCRMIITGSSIASATCSGEPQRARRRALRRYRFKLNHSIVAPPKARAQDHRHAACSGPPLSRGRREHPIRFEQILR